jgi:hypothetical protein
MMKFSERSESRIPNSRRDRMVLDRRALARHRDEYARAFAFESEDCTPGCYEPTFGDILRVKLMELEVQAESRDLLFAVSAEDDACILECPNCGQAFDTRTVRQGSLACPHCGNTDW